MSVRDSELFRRSSQGAVFADRAEHKYLLGLDNVLSYRYFELGFGCETNQFNLLNVTASLVYGVFYEYVQVGRHQRTLLR